MPAFEATPAGCAIAVGVTDAGCARASPGAASAPPTASAISFLFIENVSSSIDSRAVRSHRPLNPVHGLLQFCQSDLSISITSVIFSAGIWPAVVFLQQWIFMQGISIAYEQFGEF